jgi:hypothetical protein
LFIFLVSPPKIFFFQFGPPHIYKAGSTTDSA